MFLWINTKNNLYYLEACLFLFQTPFDFLKSVESVRNYANFYIKLNYLVFFGFFSFLTTFSIHFIKYTERDRDHCLPYWKTKKMHYKKLSYNKEKALRHGECVG